MEDNCIPHGSEGHLLRTLSKYLNFRYKLIKINSSENGDWEEMVLAVIN